MFNGLPKHCRARCATPHGVVWAAASPTATDREPLTGFGGAETGLDGMREQNRHRLYRKHDTADGIVKNRTFFEILEEKLSRC